MFITKVELENIKSYRHAIIELQRGTTAIRGANGAGKTTLVEAIGFALFNYLPYSQAQFVREGERSGQIVVEFVAADDRKYQVVRRCGTPSAWYVYDPQLEMRVADQSADVIDWLREHLPLQGEIKLDAFFSDALGVQQGTFTSDFLAAPRVRKQKFDALLQVEDYRKAYEKLRETGSYLQDRVRDLDVRIERLKAETEAIDTWREELARQRAEHDAATDELVEAQHEWVQAEQHLNTLLRQKQEIEDLEREWKHAEGERQRAEEALARATTELAEAQTAQQKVEASAEDYARYREAGAALQEAYRQQQIQQALLARRAEQERALTEARVKEEHARTQLEKAETARQEMAALEPQVQRQTALEQELAAAREQIMRLHQVEQEFEQLTADLARLSTQQQDMAQRIAAIEAQRGEAALLHERRAAVEALKLEAQRRDDRARELQRVRDDLKELAPRLEKAAAEVEQRRADVEKLYAKRELAATLPELEAAFRTLEQQILLLHTNIKRHNESKLQSVGGQCPFLREPCLNIQQRGQSSLEAYFDGLIARDQKALAPLETEWATLEQQVREVRKYKAWVDRLPEYEGYLHDARERQTELLQQVERLATRERELSEWLGSIDSQAEPLTEALALLKRSEEADRQVSRLDDLTRQYDGLSQQLEVQGRKCDELRAERARLADAPAREQAAAQQLGALGDPRSAYLRQQSLASQEGEARELLESAHRMVVQAEQALAALERELAPYAGLKARIDELTRQQEQSQAGYQMYLANEQMAGKLAERQRVYEEAYAAERQTQERYLEVEQRYLAVAGRFDREALEAAETNVDRLKMLLATLGERLRNLREDIEKKERQISEAESKKAELEAVQAERQEMLGTREMLQQFRETIRDAGPYVMKELLRQISRDANRIFGEILGDRSVELSWQEDYEIVLRSRGQTRTFAQLSGGEQMSAALAVRLALLRTLARLDIAFFDEPTQNMDDLRRSNLAEQIRRVRGFNQLIVISHDDTFEQGLDSVIYLHKRDGETLVGAEDLMLVGSGIEDGL